MISKSYILFSIFEFKRIGLNFCEVVKSIFFGILCGMKTFSDFEKEASQYQQIVAEYKKTGKQYEDKTFHPFVDIYESEFKFEKDHIWQRVDKYYKSPLFENISYKAIQQGQLGDCYFVSSLSRIAKQKELVPLLFDPKSDMKCGAVIVYLHAFGRKTPVLIDTLIPFKRGTRVPIFSKPRDIKYSPWFCLVEKAYAKLNGSYSNISGGNLHGAIYSLFGYLPCSKKISEVKTNKFEKIMKWQSKGCVIVA